MEPQPLHMLLLSRDQSIDNTTWWKIEFLYLYIKNNSQIKRNTVNYGTSIYIPS